MLISISEMWTIFLLGNNLQVDHYKYFYYVDYQNHLFQFLLVRIKYDELAEQHHRVCKKTIQ